MKHPAGFRRSYPRIIFTPEEARHLKEQPDCSPVDAVSDLIVWPNEDDEEQEQQDGDDACLVRK